MILVLLLIQNVVHMVVGTCSFFEFDSQPPLSLNCDPYSKLVNPPDWRLRIECDVRKQSSDIRSFDVRWFRRDNDSLVQDLGRIETNFESPTRIEIYYGFHILNADFHESMLGDYWCEIRNATHYFGMSNVLTILRPENYSSGLDVCSEITRNTTNTCADDFIQITSTLNGSVTTSYSNYEDIETETEDGSSTNTVIRATPPVAVTTTQFTQSTLLTSASAGSTANTILTILSTSTMDPSLAPSEITLTGTSSELVLPRVSSVTTTSLLIEPEPNRRTEEPTIRQSTPTTLPSPGTTPADLSSSVAETNSNLILASSIGGAMLLLIILLLAIIAALLCTTNKKRRSNSDETEDMQRQSVLRSSQRPLLNSSSLSPDPTFGTSYTHVDEETLQLPVNNHHYSVIRDSFQSNPFPLETPTIVLPPMKENQYYSTSDAELQVNSFTTSVQLGSSGTAAPEATGYSKLSESFPNPIPKQDDYSSLKSSEKRMVSQNDGYNVLRQQKPVTSVPYQAYSTLYRSNPSNATTTDITDSQSTDPYNKLVHVKGQMSPKEVHDRTEQQQEVVPLTVFDDPNYSTTSFSQNGKVKKMPPILPLKYQGIYERDPNYSIPNV